MALEEASLKTKAALIAIIMIFNITAASLIIDYWFFVVIVGSCTCPFLAYIIPAEIYLDIIKK